MTPELKTRVSAQVERVKTLSRKLGRVLPSVFVHLHGCYTGQPVQDSRKAWSDACERVGLVGMLRQMFLAHRARVNAEGAR